MADAKAWFRRRRRWLLLAGSVLLVLLIAAALAVNIALRRAEPFLRARVVAALEQHFHARVELDSFHVSLMNGLWAQGKGLRIWPATGSDLATSGAPLIRLAGFRFHAPLRYLPGMAIYISRLELNGLEVDVPPKLRFAHTDSPGANSKPGGGLVRISVGTIDCTHARLTLETDSPGKYATVFAIARLKLTDVGEGIAGMGFDAELTNPRPQGTIYTHGRFGPWVVDDPGESPLAGSYRFEHANLATFKGIAGILSSTGDYEGTLRDMTVDGETDTPDFRLNSGGEAMHLHTHFHAQVDGTDGDTWLQNVAAVLGQSHLSARGKITRVAAMRAPGAQPSRSGGHNVQLKVNVNGGRIEDFLRLAARGRPLLTGSLTMSTALNVPPGKEPVTERLQLNGKFLLADAQFTNQKMQRRIADLSMRGQGKPQEAKGPAASDVRWKMKSDFQMSNGVIRLPDLKYTVPGANIDLSGTYGLEGGKLNFKGTARMQATISQMVGGWKGVLLTPLDRLFEKNGAGTVVPVTIGGTRKEPQFSIDFGKLKKTSPQRPGEPPKARSG